MVTTTSKNGHNKVSALIFFQRHLIEETSWDRTPVQSKTFFSIKILCFEALIAKTIAKKNKKKHREDCEFFFNRSLLRGGRLQPLLNQICKAWCVLQHFHHGVLCRSRKCSLPSHCFYAYIFFLNTINISWQALTPTLLVKYHASFLKHVIQKNVCWGVAGHQS